MRIVQYCTWVVPSHHCWYTFSSICRLRNSWICHKYFISSVFVCVHLVADAGSCLNKRTYVGTEVSQTLIKQVHNSADECMCIPNPNSNPPPVSVCERLSDGGKKWHRWAASSLKAAGSTALRWKKKKHSQYQVAEINRQMKDENWIITGVKFVRHTHRNLWPFHDLDETLASVYFCIS